MSYELMFQRAVDLQQKGALYEAEQIYRQILETAPDNADVLNMLGLIAQEKNIHNEAINYFYKAIKSAPKHFPIYFNLAISLGAINRPLEAIEAYSNALKIKPDLKEAHLGIGNLLWFQNKIDEAKKEYHLALQIDPCYLEALTNLAEINNNTEELKKLSPNNPKALYYLGRKCFDNQNYSEAIHYLQSADSLIQSDEIKSILAQSLIALNKPHEALKVLYQALNINPQNTTVLVYIADLEVIMNNYKEAETFYKKAIETDAQNLQAHTNYANLLCKQKRTLEALEEYRKAVIISPQTPALSYNLAIILKTLEDYEQSLALMFNAFYLAPHKTEWSFNLAETLILYHLKAPEKAKKITENWLKQMPENIVVKHLWASINEQTSPVEEEYNRLLFNNFAPTYEETLKRINYQVIDKINQIYPNLTGNILDLGCGTGLVAEKLKTKNNTFDGIDISENMLDIAKQKNIYSSLEQTDIASYLEKTVKEYDLIIAADVFCYLGDLEYIIQKCYPTDIIFSIEAETDIKDFKMQPNGRYKHNPQYIENLARKIGYTEINMHPLKIRQEYGIDLNGFLFCLRLKHL